MIYFKRILKKLSHIIKVYNFNYFKTLYFNFKMLPFKQAIHLPCIFYGKIEFWTLEGNIEITSPCHFGMLKWGGKRDGFAPIGIPSHLSLAKNAKLVIGDNVWISPGCNLRIIGTLFLEENCVIGSNGIISCNNHINIGKNSRIGFNSVICDTNFHYISIDGKVYPKEGSVYIGDYCWIGNSSSITKGTDLPNHTIVAARSLVNKGFTEYGEYILLAGLPAKLKKTGVRRIFNTSLESKLQEYFAESHNVPYCLSESEKKIL